MLCTGCFMAAGAQTSFTQRLQQSKGGEGKVTVSHDKAIDNLVNGPKSAARTQAAQTSQTQDPQTQALLKEAHELLKQDDNKSTQTATTRQDNAAATPTTTGHQQEPDTTATTTAPDETHKKVMKGGYKTNGFRVQVYAGSNSRDSRVKAERVGKEMNALFPGTPVYVHFYSPRWICRIGNYRTYEEAHEVLSAVKKLGYDAAVIVKGKITVATPPAGESAIP